MMQLNYFTAIRFLWKYIGRHKRNFIMFYCGWLFDTLLGIVMPILFGIMIDEIVYHQNLQSFLRISLVFVVMSVFSCLLYFLIYAQHQYLMSMYVYDIQRDLFRHLQKATAGFLSDTRTGDVISMIQIDARECMHFVIRNIIHIFNGCISVLLLTVYLFIISPWIGLLMLAAIPASVLISARFGKKIRGYAKARRDSYGGYISYIYEVFTAIRDIRLLCAEKKVNREVVSRHRELFAVDIKAGVSTITAQNFIIGAGLLIQLAIFTLCAYLAGENSMTIGLLTVVLTFYTALTLRVQQISGAYLDGQTRIGIIQRIYDFLQAPTEETASGKGALRVSGGEITAWDLTFAYEKSSGVLQGLNLHIRPGERFALCGRSGCGKTTFGYMLLGFYRALKGVITIDGQCLSDCSLKSIRQSIGMISQEVLLFEGSIRENLLLGKSDANDGEMADVLQKAGIWEYVSGLPDGLDTVIGSRGEGLSGGQRQRIAIARIYLKNPAILIFDEATSSLDSETERQIHQSWEAMLSGRTSIIIAHRQSSVMLCDRAAIMENGRIIETGRPADLVRSSAAFRELFALGEVRADA